MRTIRFLLALLILAIPASSFGQIGIRIAIGPPALPMYDQPICPGDGYLWTPGYWAYDDSIADYYWVPGTWVQAPEEGLLWTPGYWGWSEGGYAFNEGYWGPTVGFYGGINYGFGYFGEGYGGGRWNNGHFFYNRSVNNVDIVSIHNVYNERVEYNNDNRVSYNGGRGGVETRPNSQQEAAARERHIPAVAAQTEHMRAARANPEQRAGVNHGRPTVAATAKPGDFSQEHGATPGRETVDPARDATRSAAMEPRPAVHPNELPPVARPAPVNSGNARADKKYEQQQDKLIARQTQDRQNLQQRQEAQHQQLTRQNAGAAKTQQLEQRHQQQTQQLSQKHATQQQSLQARQPQARPSQSGHGR
jgi:hypothetical protein